MNQAQRRVYMIQKLLNERGQEDEVQIPLQAEQQKLLLRGLMNVRPPREISGEFLCVQDDYLREENAARGITRLEDLEPVREGLYLWQGDITTLACDAIVNAANSGMTGCYIPNHRCIDNCIHSFAGIQLRLKCGELMEAQGCEEPTGHAKLTPAYNLPCKYVIHTVGPIVYAGVTDLCRSQLRSCYRSCLKLADAQGLGSIAFCCISTGEFRFPNQLAAEIAVHTVEEYRAETGSTLQVLFNVYKDLDLEIYQNLLTGQG